MSVYYIASFPFSDELYHGRPKGSRNGYTTMPNYKPIGKPAKGRWDASLGRYVYTDSKVTSLRSKAVDKAISGVKNANPDNKNKTNKGNSINVGFYVGDKNRGVKVGYKKGTNRSEKTIEYYNKGKRRFSVTHFKQKPIYDHKLIYTGNGTKTGQGNVSPENSRYLNAVNKAVQYAIKTGNQNYFGTGGTVDLYKRPVVPSEWLRDAGHDIKAGGKETLFQYTRLVEASNGKTHAVSITPILPNGDVLDIETTRGLLGNLYVNSVGEVGFKHGTPANIEDILVSCYDVSGVPEALRSDYISAVSNGLDRVQKALYKDTSPIAFPGDNIQSILGKAIRENISRDINDSSKITKWLGSEYYGLNALSMPVSAINTLRGNVGSPSVSSEDTREKGNSSEESRKTDGLTRNDIFKRGHNVDGMILSLGEYYVKRLIDKLK